MAESDAPYDRIAAGYAAHWGPVLVPAAHGLLGRLEALIGGSRPRILDVGTGHGTLLLEALRRWPGAELTGIDPSVAMLALLRERLAERPPGQRARVALATAFADRLPFPDASFDLAISSFVLQLVPSRARALREIRRVLRPGGRIGHVTWLAGGDAWGADDAFEAVLAELGLEPRDPGPPSGDFSSAESAAASLRRAGFRAATAEAGEVAHAFSPEGYLAFLEAFDEADRFARFDRAMADDLRRRLLARLRALDPARLVLRLPIAYATAVRPPDR